MIFGIQQQMLYNANFILIESVRC